MIVSTAMNGLFDLLTAPFGGHDTIALIVISALAGVLMLLLFKWTTRQSVLSRARGRLTGHLYELGLYQDNLGVMARIQKDLLVANLKYVLLTLPALLVLLPAAVLIMVQLEARYDYQPLQPGDTVLLSTTLTEDARDRLPALDLDTGAGLALDAAPVRDEREGRIWWRLKVVKAGMHEVAVTTPSGGRWTQVVKAEAGSDPYFHRRYKPNFFEAMLTPASKPLMSESPLSEIAIYSPNAGDWHLKGWFWIFCLASVVGGLAFKKVLRVEI
jgi:hypothetical protein